MALFGLFRLAHSLVGIADQLLRHAPDADLFLELLGATSTRNYRFAYCIEIGVS